MSFEIIFAMCVVSLYAGYQIGLWAGRSKRLIALIDLRAVLRHRRFA